MPLTEKERAYQREWHKKNKYAAQKKYKATHHKSEKEKMGDRRRSSHNYYKNQELVLIKERAKRASVPLEIRRNKRKIWDLKYYNTERGKLVRRQHVAKRRARLRAAQLGTVNFSNILLRANGLCALCKQPLGTQIDFDHIVPLVLGGSHTENNLQATHPHCNRSKGARL